MLLLSCDIHHYLIDSEVVSEIGSILIFCIVKITKITNFIAIKKSQLTNRIPNYKSVVLQFLLTTLNRAGRSTYYSISREYQIELNNHFQILFAKIAVALPK